MDQGDNYSTINNIQFEWHVMIRATNTFTTTTTTITATTHYPRNCGYSITYNVMPIIANIIGTWLLTVVLVIIHALARNGPEFAIQIRCCSSGVRQVVWARVGGWVVKGESQRRSTTKHAHTRSRKPVFLYLFCFRFTFRMISINYEYTNWICS